MSAFFGTEERVLWSFSELMFSAEGPRVGNVRKVHSSKTWLCRSVQVTRKIPLSGCRALREAVFLDKRRDGIL